MVLLTMMSMDAMVANLARGSESIGEIFVFCICVYGLLAVAWGFFLRLSKDDPRHPSAELAILCVTFGCMSAGMHVLNKSLMQSLESPGLVTACQMVMAVGALLCTSFKELMGADRQMLTTWLIIPGLFAAMLISSFYTYEFISLSLLTVVRNLAPIVSLSLETVVEPPERKPDIKVSALPILVMLVGAVVYAGGLSDFSVVGVMFAVLNLCLAVVERMTSRRLLVDNCKGLPLEVCTLVNNFVGLLPTLVLAAITSETTKVGDHAQAWTDPKVLMLMVLSGAIGIGIGYFGFAVQRIISATSFLVLQNISKVAVVLMGIVFFQDPIKSPSAMGGLLLSLIGSYWYGTKQMELAAEKAEKQKLVDEAAKSKA